MAKKKTATTKKKVVDELSDYKKEALNNEYVFKELIRAIRPDLYVLMDILDNTHVNSLTIFHVIRSISNIATGTKYGKVTVQIENGVVTFVYGEEAKKLNEPAISG